MNTAIYIHVPYCRRRCPYCDFYFVVGKPDQNFADSILEEWRERSATWHQGVAQSLYFGGGTPSLLSYNDIEKVINYFRHEGVLADDAEITLEANPEDINSQHVSELKKRGLIV
jgi:oxygen-independent coproporphyrinogen-3 oxidase